MNYPSYNYMPRFGPQTASPAFYGGVASVPAYAPQSAPAPASVGSAGGFGVQPGSTREQALAVIADPLAAGVLLPDLAHGVIYMKRFNPQTGTSDFAEFICEQPQAAANSGAVVTVEMMNAALDQLRAELTSGRGRGKREASDGE